METQFQPRDSLSFLYKISISPYLVNGYTLVPVLRLDTLFHVRTLSTYSASFRRALITRTTTIYHVLFIHAGVPCCSTVSLTVPLGGAAGDGSCGGGRPVRWRAAAGRDVTPACRRRPPAAGLRAQPEWAEHQGRAQRW